MLEVSELTKTYHEGRGVKNLSFRVESGTAFGFLGPNGAGKTTTIRLLMGFMKADRGSARIQGLDCWKNQAELKRFVSYLPGELHFIEHLTGLEFLKLIEGMHGKAREFEVKQKILLDSLELDPKQIIRKMSKGMKQKLGIVSALMLDSQVLILDEPTSGLDPLMQKIFVELIQEEKKKGKTIFMSSHQFPEIEKTCELVGIIRDGEILAVEDITRLKRSERQTFEVEVEGEEDIEVFQQSGLTLHPMGKYNFIIDVSEQQELLWRTLAQAHIKRFKQCTLELEDAFMHFYRSS
jgi:ABC-2 type transport system ATP-binding protein